MKSELHSETQNLEPTVRRQTLIALGLSFILTAIYFYDVVFTDKIFADRDMLLVYLPMFKYWAERILSGSFPDWYPYDALGQPFVGSPFSVAFHPLKLLFLFFSPGIALKVSTLFCYPIAYVGFYLLMRSLRTDNKAAHIGAILFAFNGYAVSMTNNFSYLLGMASTPWAFWLTVRLMQKPCFGRAFLAALGYALILFSGETQSFILACLGGAFIAFVIPDCEGRRRKCFFVYCGTMALAAALTCVQWVPSLQMMRDASPGASDDSSAFTWSMPFLRLPELFLGGLNGSSWTSNIFFARDIYSYKISDFWARSVYFGIPGLILAAIGVLHKDRLRIFLGGAAALCLICILGQNGGIYPLLHKFPLFTPLRYPEKLLSLWMLAMAMLAACGFHELIEIQGESKNSPQKRRCMIIFVVGALLTVLALFLEIGGGLWSEKIPLLAPGKNIPRYVLEEVARDVAACAILSFSCTILCLTACGLAFRHGRSLFFGAAAASALVLLIFGSFGTRQPIFPEIAAEPIPPLKVAQNVASQKGESPRVLRASTRLYMGLAKANPELTDELYRLNLLFLFAGNYSALFDIEMSSSYLPGSSLRFKNLMNKASAAAGMEKLSALFSNQLISIFGQDYANYGGKADRVVYEHPDLGALLVLVPDPMPKAYLSRPICVKKPEESLRGVLSKSFDFRNTAIVECGPASAAVSSGDAESANSAELGQAILLKRDPEYVSVEVDSVGEGSVLVLTDAFYTGWTASIDGTPAEILPANHVVRGVMVPRGKHLVEFRYRTPGLIPAAAVSLLTLILGGAAGLGLALFRRRREVS